jgi:acyl dehydratase
MTIRSHGINQNGEEVISFLSTTFVERKPGQ